MATAENEKAWASHICAMTDGYFSKSPADGVSGWQAHGEGVGMGQTQRLET